MTQVIDAIQATLQGNLQKAIALNLEILKENPTDIETLNRLAFAYTTSGEIKQAKATYQKVLKIDPFNPIALKNIKRLSENANSQNGHVHFHIDNNMFLEEVGKTKVITLVNTAPPKVLRTLQIGQPLTICIKRLKIFVLDDNQQFLGMLPDNISKRLIKFLKGGNKYSTYVKSADDRAVIIFMKETKRSPRFKNQPSFIINDMPKNSFPVGGKRKHHSDDEEVSEE